MAKLEIIGIPQSTYTRVVRMAAEEKGVDYDLVVETPHSDAVNAINPTGKVPVMRHGDVELFESKAIADYIDRTFDGPKLAPDDAKAAAEVEKWVSYVNTVADKTMIRDYLFAYLFPKTDDGTPDRAIIDTSMEAMSGQIAALDKAVAKTGYLAGGKYTVADMNLLPILAYIRNFPEAKEQLDKAANLTAYYERHASRPSFVNTVPPQPE